VRIVLRNSCTTARTLILADSFMSAKSMLSKTYGAENVLSFSQLTSETVVDEQTKPLSPQELQVKSMNDRAKQLTQQAKQLKARQSLAKAQQKFANASHPNITH
jgi:hypothetical protein